MINIKNYLSSLRTFLTLWFGQSISALGSSMTGFAITIWAYEKTGSAVVLSISGFLLMAPKIVIGILAGPFVDRADKKAMMIFTDIGAGICSLALFLLLHFKSLEIWHIYCLNILNSVLGSFQQPASNVAISTLIPKEHYIKANGLQSFSNGTIQMLAPVLAAAVLGNIGITGVIIIDFITLVFACTTLVLFVKIPCSGSKDSSKLNVQNYLGELLQGFKVISSSSLLRKLLALMISINLFSGLTYFNLISPMILARTANDSQALAFVNGAIGFGGIAGGLLILAIPSSKNKLKAMFLCLALSFSLGDISLAVGDTVFGWAVAGFLACVSLPVFSANEIYFWRTIIPVELQGRAFSCKYALQSGIIPIGMLLGGVLADYVFEPFMSNPPHLLGMIIGSGSGSGMALMFLITGVTGTALSILGLFSKSMQRAADEAEL